MSDQLTDIKEIAGQLDAIVVAEEDIIRQLVTASGGHLAGNFNCSDDSQHPRWSSFRIKVKINAIHVLIDAIGNVQLWTVTARKRYKGAETEFENHDLGSGWKFCRGHVSLSALVNEVLRLLNLKKEQAAKENRDGMKEVIGNL